MGRDKGGANQIVAEKIDTGSRRALESQSALNVFNINPPLHRGFLPFSRGLVLSICIR